MMETKKLGLPFEYKKYPEYFDALTVSDDTDAKNRVLEKILKKHKVKTVLDLTCGTGSQVFWLAKRGYKVIGSDFSPALLAIARDKAKQQKIKIKFIKGDMRTSKAGKFDAVITIFNAVGHLSKNDFAKAMRNIHRNLKEGGLYVFDIFNLSAMTDSVVDKLAMDVRKTVNDTKIHATQYSKVNRKNGYLTSYDRYSIQQGTAKSKIIKNKFTLQIYTAEELKKMLAENGFTTVAQYGLDGSKFLEHKTLNILTVAEKTGVPGRI